MSYPTLSEQIGKLEILQKEVQKLRAIPIGLLQTGVTRKSDASNPSAADALKAVRQIAQDGLSDGIQAALQQAKQSLELDGSDLNWTRRQEKRKTRWERQLWCLSADLVICISRHDEVPPAYSRVEDRKKGTKSVFPPLAEAPVEMEGLPEWAREFNRSHTHCKVRIRGQLLRVTLPDVMTVYMTFGASPDHGVSVETIRVLGPREARRGPYGQSQYTVFKLVSQQLATVLEAEQEFGCVKLQNLIALVASYSSLFISPCNVCGRVIPAESHVPAVVRRWEGGDWIGEHVTCSAGSAIA
jgi:hypothetical protein